VAAVHNTVAFEGMFRLCQRLKLGWVCGHGGVVWQLFEAGACCPGALRLHLELSSQTDALPVCSSSGGACHVAYVVPQLHYAVALRAAIDLQEGGFGELADVLLSGNWC
jgi:hypothetical protein